MRSFLVVSLACGAVALGICLTQTEGRRGQVRVAVAPFFNSSNPSFPNADKVAVRGGTNEVANRWLREALEKAGYEVVSTAEVEAAVKKLRIDFSQEKHRSKESLAKLGTELSCGLVVFAWITSCSQRNIELSAAISNMGRPMSESRVQARVWVFDVPGGRLLVDGKQVFQGEAKGPYFGTTRRSEMSGNPRDVEFVIFQENKKRAEWLGLAASHALHAALAPSLGLGPPPSSATDLRSARRT